MGERIIRRLATATDHLTKLACIAFLSSYVHCQGGANGLVVVLMCLYAAAGQ